MKTFHALIATVITYCFVIILLPEKTLATAFNTANFTIEYNDCNATLTVKFPFLDRTGTASDWFGELYLYVKDNQGTYHTFFQLFEDNYHLCGSCNHSKKNYEGHDWHWKTDNWYSSSASYTETSPGSKVFRFTVTLKDFDLAILGDDISVKLSGNWHNGDNGSETDVESIKAESTITISDPVGLTATSACDQVTLNWDNPSWNCKNTGVWKNIVYRNGVWLNQCGHDETYIDNTGTQGVQYTYKVRSQWNPANDGRQVYSEYTNEVSSGKTALPPNPTGLIILTNTTPCDSVIGISWNSQVPQPDSFFIWRKTNSIAWNIIKRISGSLNTYIDSISIERDTIYTYGIQSKSSCGTSGYSNNVSGSAIFAPLQATNLSATPGNNAIVLSWQDKANNETGYTIKRTGGTELIINLASNSHSYTDSDVSICQNYTYVVKAIGTCFAEGISSTSVDAVLTPNIGQTFPDNALDASKGYYPDKVVLEWSANTANELDGVNIYRRALGTTDAFIQIAAETSGSNYFVDLNTEAGTLYEYQIIGKAQCDDNTIYSDTATSIGFRTRTGVVTGQVSYNGGIAVEGVKIFASPSTAITNESLLFVNNTGKIKIKKQANTDLSDQLLFECWIKPNNYNNAFTILSKEGTYKLAYEGNTNIRFTLYKKVSNVIIDSVKFNLNKSNLPTTGFHHLAVQMLQDSVQFFVNGVWKSSTVISPTFLLGYNIDNNNMDIFIGDGFTGYLSEIRFWNISKTRTQMLQDYSRKMSGSEIGLKIYFKINEAYGNWVYDASVQNQIYNKNHGEFLGTGISFSGSGPSNNNLGLASFSDVNGNYIMNIPYRGNGEVFILTPSYLTHTFNPSTQTLFIGDAAYVYGNINFADQSSFRVTGSVTYKGGGCGVEDAGIYVDGVPIISNGTVAKTEADGSFDVRVPIGEHVLTIQQTGHIYANGRFPATGTYNFQQDLAGLLFIDSTLVKVVGRVVGGLREASKVPGLGKSKNNIGVAKITFQAQSGCDTTFIFTDGNTGEYTVWLPPLKYIPTVKIPSNPTIDFGTLNLVDLGASTTEITKIDSMFDFDGDFIPTSPTITFHKQLDYIHRENPVIAVYDPDGIQSFIGDSIYTTQYGTDINLRQNPFRWPVMHQGDDDHLYRCMIKVFEPYTNFDTLNNIKKDSVPTTDGKLKITNELAEVIYTEVTTDQFNTLDSLKNLIHTFKPGFPNFETNVSIPDYSFTGRLEILLEISNGTVIHWLPVASIPPGGDGVYRYYLLGTRSNGTQFATAGPQVVEYVLRDPPGSESSASREIESKKIEKSTWSWNLGAEAHTEDNMYLGAKFNIGIGVSTATEIVNNNTLGFSATISGGRGGSQTVETTNTQEWSTYANTAIPPGASSDLYIGKSKNIEFGVSEELTIIPNSLTDTIEPLGNPNQPKTGFSFGKKYGLSLVPKGYETQFIFSQYDIINLIIPNLISLRNKILQSNPKYQSHLPISDENYGANNDNVKAFGSQASSNTPTVYEFVDLDGPSYAVLFPPGTTVLEKVEFVDSIRLLNNQVKLWEDAIYLNEWEKVNINNQTAIDSLRELELQNLENEYADVIAAYATLVALNGVSGIPVAYGLIATPVPGTAAAGYVAFAVTTATGIAVAEIAEEFETYLDKKERINEKFDQLGSATNFTLTGGTNYTSSVSQSSAIEHNSKIEYEISAALKVKVEGKVSNTGVGIEKGLELKYSSSREWGNEESESETVSFNLNDPDIGDLYSVDVYPSMLGWGPIFKNRQGGYTACPYEPAQYTEYYNPGTEISARTLQIDKPTLSVSPSKLTNIPVDEAAVFNLTVGNASEVGYIMGYDISVAGESNPFGAIVRIDGLPTSSVVIAGGTAINKVLTIEKGPGSVYNYDDILVLVHSQCQFAGGAGWVSDIVDSVYVSAHFLPSCSEIKIAVPDDKWVLNNSFNNSMQVAITDYNINFFDLENLRLDYKPSSSSQWIGLQTFLKDTVGLNDPNAVPIPQNIPFILYPWDVSQLTDGNYDLRVVSNCELSENNSLIHSGVVDRINPHPFGHPSPADGICSPNDEISIKFNEPIDLGSINPAVNFDIRGVLNGSTVDHSTSLNLDGINDYAEVIDGIPLDSRDFTIEFSVKRNGLGEQALFVQGSGTSDQIYIGFDASNKLVFKINGTSSILSTKVFNDFIWHYIAISYNYTTESVEFFLADEQTTAQIINTGNTSIQAKYTGVDTLFFIGKNPFTNSNYFNGNLHELRIWSKSRSLSEFSLYKSKLLTGRESGLVYNWRMDEATGNTSMDQVRNREAILYGPTWQISPTGKAADFNATSSQYVKVQTGNIAITKEMDFTLEFWFKSGQSTDATLFTNGNGNGIGSDSLFAWNIDKVGNFIHIKHKKFDFTATNANYFDNTWHHFAMVLQRSGNLSVYVDGNFENSMSADNFEQLGGAYFWLGAKVNVMPGLEQYSNYFTGLIDEFRFWNMARTYEQIARDKQNRMEGDELGLELYLPFEAYSTDPTGVKILTGTFNDQIKTAPHTVNVASATLSSNTPVIKLQRPVQKVAFTYSVNNDEIIFTPTTSPYIIENVTLDVSVEGIKDLHGNVLQSPVTWIAYMDKNQVVWQDDLLKYAINKGEALTFKSGVFNKGGAAKKFNILDLPSWLTASPSSGIIAPNSSIEVVFTVDPNINLGQYNNDVSLLTDFNFREKLAIDLQVNAIAPDWKVDPSKYEFTMSIVGTLKINGINSTDVRDKIAAMIDQEVRGVANLQYVPSIDAYRVFLNVYNTEKNPKIAFRIWDASTGKVYSEVTPTNILFTTDSIRGSLLNPTVFESGSILTYELPIYSGWNWLTFFLDNDSNAIDTVLVSVAEDKATVKTMAVIKNNKPPDLVLSDCNANNSWNGSLKGDVLIPTNNIKLKKTSNDTLVLKGTVVNPTTRTITLYPGWTWIGFVSIRQQEINAALSNLTPTTGDLIKGKYNFAIYNGPALGWIGSLKTMIPGEGYMYKSLSSSNKTFKYPVAGMFDNITGNLSTRTKEDELWSVDHHPYNNNMTAITKVNTPCLELIESGTFGIGAMDAAGNWRGKAPVDLIDEQAHSFLTIAGDANEFLAFKLIHADKNTVFDLKRSIQFIPNEHLGNMDFPYTLEMDDFLCKTIKYNNDQFNGRFVVYPQVVKDAFNIEFTAMNEDDHASLSITNMLGQEVINKKVYLRKGFNAFTQDISQLNGVAGSYVVRLLTKEKFYSEFIQKIN